MNVNPRIFIMKTLFIFKKISHSHDRYLKLMIVSIILFFFTYFYQVFDNNIYHQQALSLIDCIFYNLIFRIDFIISIIYHKYCAFNRIKHLFEIRLVKKIHIFIQRYQILISLYLVVL